MEASDWPEVTQLIRGTLSRMRLTPPHRVERGTWLSLANQHAPCPQPHRLAQSWACDPIWSSERPTWSCRMIGQQSPPILVADTGEDLDESRTQRQSPERRRKKLFNSLDPRRLELFISMDQEFHVFLQLAWFGSFPGGLAVKNLPAMQEPQEIRVRSLGREDPWRRAWQPTLVFLPGESHGQRSLVGYSP